MAESWTQSQAIRLCTLLEEIAPAFGYHVALTGGTLYKDGPRKDVDIMFYRIRQWLFPDDEGLMAALKERGFVLGPRLGWVQKAKFDEKKIDFFFPNYSGAEHVPGSNSTTGY